ncbi:hypothetical protein [Peribacillus simplex]|uniref:hypothetical protein n=1 Tax=Peribacillus simplex TaxID=1478 RepID=UPI00367263BD
MNIELLELINEYMEKGDFIGEVSEDYIARAEKILEVNFPPEYKEFVNDISSKKELDRYTTFYVYLQDSFQEAIDNWD